MENMEVNMKCSLKEHEEINANIYCQECKIYMCNRCINLHSGLFKNHHTFNLDKKLIDMFTGLCLEKNHSNNLEYFCKTHNKLCCGLCIAKIKKVGNCQHTDCDVCTIEDIKDEKKNNLLTNIKYLEDLSLNLEEAMNKLKNINEIIIKKKEDLKSNIQNIFTKIRNCLNEREDQLLLDVDKKFEKVYFKENTIKSIEKLPNKIKISLEKGKTIKWEDNNLAYLINDCINIENNIKEINNIKDFFKKYDNINSNIFFKLEDNGLNILLESIKKFGYIYENENNFFRFRFKEGKNYLLSNNGKIATRNNGYGFNCCIIGNKEIPKNKISKWKLKINSDITNAYLIGVGPDNPNNEGEFYQYCWTYDCNCTKDQLIIHSGCYSNYANNKYSEKIKKEDIIGVEINRIDNHLSFSINDKNCGIACYDIPKNDTLYPIVMFYNLSDSIEIMD